MNGRSVSLKGLISFDNEKQNLNEIINTKKQKTIRET